MVRFRVWSKGQAMAILAGVILLTAIAAAGGTMLLLRGGQPIEGEGAVSVFGEGSLFMEPGAETTVPQLPEDTPTPETTPQETVEPTPDKALHVEIIRDTPVPSADGKKVLIYHTHTWEAYEQVQDAPYEPTEKWRTKDNTANVVAVGTALQAQLEALGCTVVHDTTAFEPPNLSTAYIRSLSMLEERAARGETYDLYIDLHRDAIASNSTLIKTVNVGGERIARFMVLIGKGTGEGFDVKPDWEANCAFAQCITDSLNGQVDNLCREVKIKTGRFNQHIAPQCVLIECGNNYNTLEEVLNGVPYLAQSIMDALNQGQTE